jgi:hypothetical protein
MRPTDEQVRQAILHPEQEVREAAVNYLADGHTNDVRIMPLVIQAIQQWGWKDAFEYYQFLQKLPQSPETLDWLLKQLPSNKEAEVTSDEVASRYHVNLVRAIEGADTAVLESIQERIEQHLSLPDDAKVVIHDRIYCATREPDELWAELTQFCEAAGEAEDPDFEEFYRIVEALGPHGEVLKQRVFDILKNPNDGWLTTAGVRLAGEMRLQEAIPHLLPWLVGDRWDYHGEDGMWSLERIGGSPVVEALANAYPAGDWGARMVTANILGNIHIDHAEQTLLQLLATETDSSLKGHLLCALMNGFCSDGIEPARQFLLHTKLDPDFLEVRSHLITLCKLVNHSFPELDYWIEARKSDREFRHAWYQRQYFQKSGSWDDNELDDEEVDEDTEWTPPAVRLSSKIGRNDQCPCGSGKKYKKCCLGKANVLDE